MDARGIFHYGFIYRNGSNYRAVCWENGQRVNRTVPRWASVFVFIDVATPLSFSSSNFSASDFNMSWFDSTAQMDLQMALMAWKKMEMDNLAYEMVKLSI